MGELAIEEFLNLWLKRSIRLFLEADFESILFQGWYLELIELYRIMSIELKKIMKKDNVIQWVIYYGGSVNLA